jgi:hypothetical protein
MIFMMHYVLSLHIHRCFHNWDGVRVLMDMCCFQRLDFRYVLRSCHLRLVLSWSNKMVVWINNYLSSNIINFWKTYGHACDFLTTGGRYFCYFLTTSVSSKEKNLKCKTNKDFPNKRTERKTYIVIYNFWI